MSNIWEDSVNAMDAENQQTADAPRGTGYHRAELERLIAEEEAKEKAAREAARKAKKSAALVLQYEKAQVRNKIACDTLAPEDAANYLARFQKMFSPEQVQKEYMALACQMLTNEYYGAELLGLRIGNGNIVYKGHTHASVSELHEHILEELGLEDDPTGSDVFFKVALAYTLKHKDSDLLAVSIGADTAIWNGFLRDVAKAQEKYKADYLQLPAEADLTIEDMIIISELSGGGFAPAAK